MASCNPINFIIWLLILLFISFFVAGFCAPFYILIYAISAFISSLGDGSGDLVYYDRPDTEGPKLSNFEKTHLTPDACNGIEQILSTAYGTLGIVEKVRLLYHVGQTRIHVDQVTGLGSFMELEVVLADNDSIEQGEQISKDLMEKLGITKDSLISGAYMDLLLKK